MRSAQVERPDARPEALPVDFDAIPAELKARSRWCVWRYEWDTKKSRWIKPPRSMIPPNLAISVNDPEPWGSFEMARQAYERGGWDGVGILLEGDGITALDLDKCMSPATGELTEDAGAVLAEFDGTYTERSPSGRGIRVLCRGRMPRDGYRSAEHGFEAYQKGRYVTITGRAMCEPDTGINDAQEALDWFLSTYFPPDRQNTADPARPIAPTCAPDDAVNQGGGGPSDEDVLSKARSKPEFVTLFDEGNLDPFGGDHSTADFRLMCMLAFWTGRNPDQMARLFQASALGQRGKASRPDYLERTIEAALSSTTEAYSWRTGGTAEPFDFGGSTAQLGTGKAPATKKVEIIHAESIQPKPIRWLWRGWLARGKLHVIAGAPGTGKTSIALALAATITTAGRWPDGSTSEPGNVLIWSGEDDPHDTLVPRLLAAGADRARCYFVGDVADMGERRVFDPAKDMAALAYVAGRIGNIRLMIVDPIVSAVSGDSHKNAEVRRGLAPLVELAGKLDCALLGVSHFSKGTAGRDPLERVTGSLAFGALARIVFAAFKESEDDGGGRVFCRTKSNIGPDVGGFRYDLRTDELPGFPGVEASSVLWGEAVDGSARDLLARAEAVTDPDERSAVGEACGFLQALLADGPVSSKAVRSECEGAGHAWSTVRRAQKQLGVIVSKEGGHFGGGKQQWTWALPGRSCPKKSEDACQKTWASSKNAEHLQREEAIQPGGDESTGTAKIFPWSKGAGR
jgi:hypothetical protein